MENDFVTKVLKYYQKGIEAVILGIILVIALGTQIKTYNNKGKTPINLNECTSSDRAKLEDGAYVEGDIYYSYGIAYSKETKSKKGKKIKHRLSGNNRTTGSSDYYLVSTKSAANDNDFYVFMIKENSSVANMNGKQKADTPYHFVGNLQKASQAQYTAMSTVASMNSDIGYFPTSSVVYYSIAENSGGLLSIVKYTGWVFVLVGIILLISGFLRSRKDVVAAAGVAYSSVVRTDDFPEFETAVPENPTERQESSYFKMGTEDFGTEEVDAKETEKPEKEEGKSKFRLKNTD